MKILHKQHIAIIGLGVTGSSILRFLLNDPELSVEAISLCDDRLAKLKLDEVLGADLYALCQKFTNERADKSAIEVVGNAQAQSLPESCDLVLASPGVSHSHPWLKTAFDKNLTISSDIELFLTALHSKYRADLEADTRSPAVVAITGSNGKSTVVSALGFALNRVGVKTQVLGNIGKPVLDALKDCLALDVIVLELSSFQLDLLNNASFDLACVLNVTPDHLDRYSDFDAYHQSKLSIYDKAKFWLWNEQDALTVPKAVSCEDHAATESLATGESKTSAAQFKLSNRDGLVLHTVRLIELSKDKAAVFIQPGIKDASDSQTSLEVKGGSSIWLSNVCAVIAAAASLSKKTDINLSRFCAALSDYDALPHRYQRIASGSRYGHQIDFIDDSKATNEGAALQALHAAKAQYQFVVLIAGGLSKGAELTEFKRAVAALADFTLLIGEAAAELDDALPRQTAQQCTDFKHCLDVFDQWLINQSVHKRSGALLLSPACASMDMFNNYKERGLAFQEAVNDYLAEAAA